MKSKILVIGVDGLNLESAIECITTDHISPAGSIKKDSPAGKYLMDHGVDPKDFNSYGGAITR